MRVLGLMSGTSADGIDAAMVDFSGRINKPKWKLLNICSYEYPRSLRKRILDVSQGLKLDSEEWLDLEERITEFNAYAAFKCDPLKSSQLVGCHGQTIFHRPPTKKHRGSSLQILRAPLLAQLLQRPVVYDFRAADLANGGQGAPLVPLVDEVFIGRECGWRAILNLGGIANLTLIPPNQGMDSSAQVLGWDCGPANTLVDLAIQEFTQGRLFFDKDGSIAQSGIPDELIISKWIDEYFFHLPPPKSTGREQFGANDLHKRMTDMSHLSIEDKIATLTAFTAQLVAQDLINLNKRSKIRPIELLVAGGGAQNLFLMKQLVLRCKGLRVSKLQRYGIPVLAREALAFALLAWWNINNYSSASKQITGAHKSVVLGVKVNPF